MANVTTPNRRALAAALGKAAEDQRAGRLEEAETAYRRVLAAVPTHADANHQLGVILSQTKRPGKAVAWIERAIAAEPGRANYHASLAEARRALGHAAKEAAALRALLALEPDDSAALHKLCAALIKLKRYEEVLQVAERAAALDPSDTLSLNNQGVALQALGRVKEAEQAYRDALERSPDYAQAHSNLGVVLQSSGRKEEAEASYRRAIEIKPEYTQALGNLAALIQELGRAEEAEEMYRRVLALSPDYAEAHNNLGNLLQDQGRLEEALQSYRRTIEIAPKHRLAYNNMALALQDQGKLGEALASLTHQIELAPDFAEAQSARLRCFNFDPKWSPAEICAAHREWAAARADKFRPERENHANTREPERPLRVGYMSPDFRVHSVAYFFQAVLGAHDREAFHAICYANAPQKDDMTAHLRELAGDWRETFGKSDDEVAAMLIADEIDILVDLAGHTGLNRMLTFARRPAPVQLTYLGYCCTTGNAAIDYRLSDWHTDPPGQEEFHAETLYRLERGFLCYSAPDSAPEVGPPPSSAKAGMVTFGSFNTLAKVTPEVVALWAKVLAAVPGSRFLLKAKSLSDEATRVRYRALFESHGIEAERIEMQGRIKEKGDHLAAYGRVDIALDTFPYNGVTTSCEAMWMGVPVVTLEGQSHAGRLCASLLHGLELEQLIAADEAAFVAAAKSLAEDGAALADLRASLRGHMEASELRDGAGLTRAIEAAYRDMWRKWCAGSAPAQGGE
jgi:predicted O-linked N-acetylglucosamine transferase (SPINDLY family)